jgi:hypothetical protein
MQDSLRALTAHSTAARCAMEKSPKQEILASNNLKGKRRAISTGLVSDTRERSAQLLPDIPLNRTCAAVSNGAPFSTSYLGDTGIKISR